MDMDMPARQRHFPSSQPSLRAARSYIAVLAYLVAFTLLLVVLLKWYLIPAVVASEHAGPEERRKLAAGALLVMVVVLFAAMAGLALTFRVGRFFFPRPTPPRKRTEYVDAWAESARRMPTPPAEEHGEPPVH
jgi:hypothetical protein